MLVTRSAGSCSDQNTFGNCPRCRAFKVWRLSIRAVSSSGVKALLGCSSDIGSGPFGGGEGSLQAAGRVVLAISRQTRCLLRLVHGLAAHHSVEIHLVAVEL